MFVAIAVVLRKVWVWVHRQLLATPRQGGRKLNLRLLPFYQRDAVVLGTLTAASGGGIVLFGMYFRRMHAGGPHMVNVDESSPNPPMQPTGSAGG